MVMTSIRTHFAALIAWVTIFYLVDAWAPQAALSSAAKIILPVTAIAFLFFPRLLRLRLIFWLAAILAACHSRSQ